jgi:hypothetical protein
MHSIYPTALSEFGSSISKSNPSMSVLMDKVSLLYPRSSGLAPP